MEGGGWRVEGGQCILGGGSRDGGWKGGDEGWTVYSGWMIRRDGGWGGGGGGGRRGGRWRADG